MRLSDQELLVLLYRFACGNTLLETTIAMREHALSLHDVRNLELSAMDKLQWDATERGLTLKRVA